MAAESERLAVEQHAIQAAQLAEANQRRLREAQEDQMYGAGFVTERLHREDGY
jgi:hypothetical protein